VCLVEYLIRTEVQGRWKGVRHLLLSYVFARQLWFTFLLLVGLHDLAPQVGEISFDDWQARISNEVDGMARKGLRGLVHLEPEEPLRFRWSIAQLSQSNPAR